MSQITVTKVVEGASHVVIRVDLLGDGTGELDGHVILAPSDLNPASPNNVPAFRLMQVWYGLIWFDVALSVGTIIPSPLWSVSRDSGCHADFRSFGGLLDLNVYNSPPSDDNGKLTLSTNGLLKGSIGSLVLELRKTNQASA